MSKLSDYLEDKSVSKGGLIGGLIGILVSGKAYSSNDNRWKKAGKTGLFAVIGYIIGEYLEKFFNPGKRKNSF